MEKKIVGFVGIGDMGKGMALNMLKSNATLIVNDINDKNFGVFVERGVEATTNLKRVAEADIIFLSLPHTKAVEQVVLSSEGLYPYLREGQIIVDLSTISYNNTIEIGKKLSKISVNFLDAPVSGMISRANDGTLTVMCGGDEEVFNQVKPYFECIGNKILYMGLLGSGQLTKLINQLLFDINTAALAEILPFATIMGLDCDKVGQVINSGTGRSYASEFFIPRILNRNFNDGYKMGKAYKDLISASEISAHFTIPMPVLAAATATYQTALRQGYEDCDKGGMIQVFEKILNVTYQI
jgi:3-hydroxyisobutyrate dehydrogenase-like beta-hydroxyacid dehydrogenase